MNDVCPLCGKFPYTGENGGDLCRCENERIQRATDFWASLFGKKAIRIEREKQIMKFIDECDRKNWEQ